MASSWRFPASAVVLIATMILVPLGAVVAVRAFGAPLTALPVTVPTVPHPLPVVAPEPAPVLRGHILDANGAPVPGASVHLLSASLPAAVLATTTTDASGSFSVVHVGTSRLRVDADHDPDGAVRSAELHVAEGETTEVTLILSPAAVRGIVVDPAERPIVGATLSIDGVPWAVENTTSDGAGAFRFPLVPFEASSIVAVATGYRSARVVLPPREDAPEPTVRLQLRAAPPADGDVLDPDGKPVKARVVACEGQPAEARVVSGDDGTFRLPASAIGCEAVALHDELGPSEPTAVIDGKRTVLRLRVGGSIEGTVVDARGATVPVFSVGVESYVGAHGASSKGMGSHNFDGGTFLLSALAPGTYVLTAGAAGTPPTRSDPVDVQAGIVTRGVRIMLLPGGTVAGSVYDDHHNPIAGVRLSFDRVSATIQSAATATTDEWGAYRLDGSAPGGLFTLLAQKDGYRSRFLSGLRVASGGTLAQDVILTAVDGGASFELGGIGAGLAAREGAIEVMSVFPGDPAERAGLRAGDRIVQIDDEDTAGMSISDALQRMRGQAGTSVAVTARHTGATDTFDVVIVRATIAH